MKEYFYYQKIGSHPRITVCLLVNDKGEVARGVAACSFSENPIKAEGRKKARAYAYKAITNGNIMSNKSRSQYCDCPLGSNRYIKGEYMPRLSKMEKRILAKHLNK